MRTEKYPLIFAGYMEVFVDMRGAPFTTSELKGRDRNNLAEVGGRVSIGEI